MKLVDLFPVERVFVDVNVSSREELLGFLAQKAADMGLVDRQLCLDALTAREELGSTGLGNGIALPHARIDGIEHTIGMFASLSRPIDFEAVDQEPVSIVIMLLMPDRSGSEQMKVLSQVARLARQDTVMTDLRHAASAEDVVAVLRGADEEA